VLNMKLVANFNQPKHFAEPFFGLLEHVAGRNATPERGDPLTNIDSQLLYGEGRILSDCFTGTEAELHVLDVRVNRQRGGSLPHGCIPGHGRGESTKQQQANKKCQDAQGLEPGAEPGRLWSLAGLCRSRPHDLFRFS